VLFSIHTRKMTSAGKKINLEAIYYNHVARMVERRGVYRVLVGKHEGKKPLGRPRRKWDDNIKMDIKEEGERRRTGLIWLRTGTGGGHL
jgi:hypothetical protein